MLCKICETNIGQIVLQSLPRDKSISLECLISRQNCAFCLGLLCDDPLLDSIAEEAARVFQAEKFDGTNFLLAMNMPPTQVLRELIVEKLSESKWAPAMMSPKELCSRILMDNIGKSTGLRPSLNSNLILTISIEMDEFNENDFDFFIKNFPGEFIKNDGHGNSRKCKRGCGNGKCAADNVLQQELLLTKQKMRTIRNEMSIEVAKKYKMLPPSKKCTFSAIFEREPVFIGGRYCKYSRCLPQSPWGPDSDGPDGTSVAQKVSPILVKHFAATSSKFSASGREDMDVRMLGRGRPFVVQLLNAHKTAELDDGNGSEQILADLVKQINDSDCDISVHSLTRVSGKQAQILNIGQEEKRKTYSALCYSKVPLADSKLLEFLGQKCPVEIRQKTVIRVLKRRPLLERVRHIHWMDAFKIDNFHFMLRLQTQAGTYVKEFVHGDFGRTRPSLAELMSLELGQVDILHLDVLEVDLEWPPT